MNLKAREWSDFLFGDLISDDDIYKAKAVNKDELTEATDFKNSIRYITRTGENNGCEMLADLRYVDSQIIEKANAITIGDTTATCFYQDENFITGDHMVVVRANDWLNKYTALYILTLLNKEQFKYSYGRAFLIERIKKTMVKLPVAEGGKPDWQYMEKYIKSLRCKPLTTKNAHKERVPLKIEKWKPFKVGRVFQILNGKGITTEEIEENPGNFYAVQSGEENNGVLGKIDLLYCKEKNYSLSERSCLTVARSGSAGFVSYQHNGCVVGDSAKILLLPENVASTGVYLFLQTILTANRFKYAYGRKVTEDKYANEEIKLPVLTLDNGKPAIDCDKVFSDEGFVPDWRFMNNYVKSLTYADRL